MMNRLRSLVALACLLCAAPATAQIQVATYETVTVSTTAVAIGATTLRPAGFDPVQYCQARVETDAVRIRIDGTSPTSSVGVELAAGDIVQLFDLASATAFRAIRSGSASASLAVACWRPSPFPGLTGFAITTGGGADVTSNGADLATETTASAIATTLAETLNINIETIDGADPLAAAFQGTLQSAASADGNGNPFNVNGYEGAVVSNTITGTATVTFEGTQDGTNYVPIVAARLGTTFGLSSTVSTTGYTHWYLPVAGFLNIRAVISGCSGCSAITTTARAVVGGGRTVMAVASLKPDGTNTQPSMDAAARRGYVQLTDGTYTEYVDPCKREARTQYVVNLSSSGTTEIANAVASEFFYICSVEIVSAAANNIVIAEANTDGCGSISAGITGGTTAATGQNFAANGGWVLPPTGQWHAKTTTANRYLCILLSASTQTSGVITYVSEP